MPLVGPGVCKAMAFRDETIILFFFLPKRNSSPCMSFNVLKLCIHLVSASPLFILPTAEGKILPTHKSQQAPLTVMNLKFPAFPTILHLQFISSDATTVLGGVTFSLCRERKRLMDLPAGQRTQAEPEIFPSPPQVWSLTHALTCWASVAGAEAGG